MPEPIIYQPGIYRPGDSCWIKMSTDDPKWIKMTIRSKLLGSAPFDFATANVVLADFHDPAETSNAVEKIAYPVVLKIFDHTASSNLRCRFTDEEYGPAQHEILRSASEDGSLAQLWHEFQRVVALDRGSDLHQIAINLKISPFSPDITYGELVCRYVIGMKQKELQEELRRCKMLPEMTPDFSLKAYFLWMRQLFLHENAIGKILDKGPEQLHRKMPAMFLGTRITSFPTQEHRSILSLDEYPVIVQEYIAGQPLSKVEKALRDDSNPAQPGPIGLSNQRNIDRCISLLPRSKDAMTELLASICSMLDSFLDEGLVFEDFRSDQAIVQRRRDGTLLCRFVGYGFLRPFRRIRMPSDLNVVEPERRFQDFYSMPGLLSSSRIVSRCPEKDLRFYLPVCYGYWPESFRHISLHHIGLRFQALPTTTSTLRWRVLLEDIRTTLSKLGASDRVITWATEFVKGLTASLTYSVGDSQVLVLWLIRLFASSLETELDDLVQNSVRNLESHTSILLKISENMDASWRTTGSSLAGSDSSELDIRDDLVSDDNHTHNAYPTSRSLPSDYIPPMLTLTYRSPVTLIPQPIWNDMDLWNPSTEVEEVVRQRLEERVQHLKQKIFI